MRDALWRTFRPDAMAVLARYEGVLAQASKVGAITLPPAKVASVPRGSTPIDRIIALVERAGGRGITKSDIRERFPKPRPDAAQLDAWLAEICEADVIRWEMMKIVAAGTEAKRYFHFSHASPRVVMGVAVLD